jgi:hypothetical protein
MLKPLLLALALASVLAQSATAAGCETVLAAQVKGLGTPSHAITKIAVSGAGITTLETISAGGKMYTKDREGNWKAEPEKLNETALAKYWPAQTCSADGADTIDGETTDIVLHRTVGFPPTDTRFWISRSSGLIVKTVIKTPGSAITTETDFLGIEAPAPGAIGMQKYDLWNGVRKSALHRLFDP